MSDPKYYWYNRSELLELARRRGYRLRRSLPHEQLVAIAIGQAAPGQDDLAETVHSRARLEAWIDKNRMQILSQLPCNGEHRGRCQIYPCSEGRHMNCYLDAEQGGHLL